MKRENITHHLEATSLVRHRGFEIFKVARNFERISQIQASQFLNDESCAVED